MLARLVNDLATLNRSTETDFLAVGKKLSLFRSTAHQISNDIVAIAELFSGEHGQNAARAMTRSLEHSSRLDQRIAASCQALNRVSELSEKLRRPLANMPNTVSVFRTLCTLTRIETSRLGGAGADLGHLAEEIRPLSEGIQAAGEHVLTASEALNREVQAAIRDGEQLRRAQLLEIPALTAGVQQTLQALEQRRRLALETSTRQSSQYAAVTNAIDDLVASIQFHDITRQQVEHVMEVFRQLRAARRGQDQGGLRPRDITVLTLQSSQLFEAAQTFASSAERIERDLGSIAELLKDAAESANVLTEHSSAEQTSYLAKLEKQVSAILQILHTCESAESQIHRAGEGLAETVARMRTSMNEIRGTGIQIQRISTNATIRAIHIGAPGVALNKIAENMQRMALDCNATTEEVSETLQVMLEAGKSVSAAGAESGDAAIQNLGGDMQVAARELHVSAETSFARVTEVAALASQLGKDIAEIRTGFSVGRRFAEIIERVRRELKALGAEDGPVSLEHLGEHAVEHLENFAKTYTMQKQRDVHARIVGAASSPDEVAAGLTEPLDSELPPNEFGANVDLF